MNGLPFSSLKTHRLAVNKGLPQGISSTFHCHRDHQRLLLRLLCLFSPVSGDQKGPLPVKTCMAWFIPHAPSGMARPHQTAQVSPPSRDPSLHVRHCPPFCSLLLPLLRLLLILLRCFDETAQMCSAADQSGASTYPNTQRGYLPTYLCMKYAWSVRCFETLHVIRNKGFHDKLQ